MAKTIAVEDEFHRFLKVQAAERGIAISALVKERFQEYSPTQATPRAAKTRTPEVKKEKTPEVQPISTAGITVSAPPDLPSKYRLTNDPRYQRSPR